MPDTHRRLELAAGDLADWVERQGPESWWLVDGDPELTGRIGFPCPGEDLAAELRRIGESLVLIDDRDTGPPGVARVGLDDLDRLAFVDEPRKERLFHLNWARQAKAEGWLLVEDRESPRLVAIDASSGDD